ncbi:MAG: disulfide bond formation protein B [Nevskiales bacterium]
MSLTFRNLSLLGFLICAGGLGFAYLLEFAFGLAPCPLCIFQRIAMFAAALAFLAGAIHNPVGWGRWGYSFLALIGAGAGVAIAGRHVWLQHLPADQVPACGPPLDYLLEILPFTEVMRVVLRGDADCAKVDAAWLGLSLPAWTLIAFVAIALYALVLPTLVKRSDKISQ